MPTHSFMTNTNSFVVGLRSSHGFLLKLGMSLQHLFLTLCVCVCAQNYVCMQGVYAVGNFQPSEDRSRCRPPPPILREPPLSTLPNVSQTAISNSHQGKTMPGEYITLTCQLIEYITRIKCSMLWPVRLAVLFCLVQRSMFEYANEHRHTSTKWM